MESATREADHQSGQFEYRGFSELFGYWSSARNGAAIPSLKDFDLLSFPHLLPDMGISEVRSPTDIHIRFMGTAIVERFGYDPTGKNSLLNQPEERRDAVGRWYALLVSHPCGGLARFTNIYSSGREVVAESLFLPLQGESQRCFVSLARMTEFLNWQTVSSLTVTAARVLDFVWIDLGLGVPAIDQSIV